MSRKALSAIAILIWGSAWADASKGELIDVTFSKGINNADQSIYRTVVGGRRSELSGEDFYKEPRILGFSLEELCLIDNGATLRTLKQVSKPVEKCPPELIAGDSDNQVCLDTAYQTMKRKFANVTWTAVVGDERGDESSKWTYTRSEAPTHYEFPWSKFIKQSGDHTGTYHSIQQKPQPYDIQNCQ